MSTELTNVDKPLPFGKYELIDRLGRGGMADVWRARVAGPQGFERVLVLKRILPHLVEDKKARELFEREARVISRLSHANIVKVFEFGEVDGEYYLTMEYVEGRDLAAVIRAGGATPGLAALVIRDVCRALAYANKLCDEKGTPLRILHRDISPSNIMIGYDGAVRLLDFGIAKALADPRDKRTAKGTIRGKFGYIAPEIIDGVEADGRADLFSVGVVLHEALVGKRLFRGASDLETLALVKRAVIPTPLSLNPSVPPALDAATMRALERDREKRFDDGNHMAEALDEVVHQLRFGPTQLAEKMAALFPRSNDLSWLPESSGPHTVRESDPSHLGFGTAQSLEIDPDERVTTPMSTDSVARAAREAEATSAARRMKHHEVVPPAASSEQPRSARNDGRSTSPAPRVAAPIAPAQRTQKRGKSSGTLYLIGGVLVGGAITGLVLLARDVGPFSTKPSETPAAAVDLARPSPDLAHADLAGVEAPAK
jgi:serine/threonine protein kinase